MAPKLRIADLKIKIVALEKKMFWTLCTNVVFGVVLAYLVFSSFQIDMSEPWNNDRLASNSTKPDWSAKLMLYGGLTLSLATLIVGSIVKPVVQKAKIFKKRANKKDE